MLSKTGLRGFVGLGQSLGFFRCVEQDRAGTLRVFGL